MNEALSNINSTLLAPQANVGIQKSYFDPDLIVGAVIVPKGTIVPAVNMVSQAAFATYISATSQGFQANGTAAGAPTRWYMMYLLDAIKDSTKKAAVDDSGLVQNKVIKYNTLLEFMLKGPQANMGNWKEWLKFNNRQNFYGVFFIDLSGYWWGCEDPTGAGGLASYSLSQLWIDARMSKTDKKLNEYGASFQLLNEKQFQEQVAYFPAQTDPSAIPGLQNLVLTNVTSILGTQLSITATTTAVFCGKTGSGSDDFFLDYQGSLTAGCFRAYNLSTGAAATIASITQGTATNGGQTYNYVVIVLSAAPTATNVVQFSIGTTSVVNAIIPNANVTIDGYPGNSALAANGNNTF